MLYLKHAELVENYRVSLKTIHNWIDAAKSGKSELHLYEQGGRTYVANVPENAPILANLAKQGKKYRNTLHHKIAMPTEKFYKIYSRQQILDIITNLNTHHEVPRQYNYFDQGAVNWDKYVERMQDENDHNVLQATKLLLHNNYAALDNLIDEYKKINIIDLGCGNAAAARELLEHLKDRNVLNRYIAIDISPDMLRIAERNIKDWFGDTINFEGHVKDINHERFDDLLVDDMLSKEADTTLNIALFFGCTIMNFRQPEDSLKAIYGSLGRDDLLLYVEKLDSEQARYYLDFSANPGSTPLSPNHRFIFDLLNIDESFYEVEKGFNEHKRMRYVRVRLKTALTINFKFDDIDRKVSFHKGETILLLRVWHQIAPEIISNFEKNGLTLLHGNLTKDRQYLLTISGVDMRTEET